MTENSYGVVVGQYGPGFGVWLLFRGEESFLSSLDPQVCSDPLRIGDIVQARTSEKETVVRRGSTYPDAVWSDRDRVVVRSIANFNMKLNSGSWKDESTGFACVLLVSRDIGIIVSPVEWYNREFFNTRESTLLVYAEFRPGQLSNIRSGKNMEAHWRIRENRISLPAVPSSVQDPSKFLVWNQIRKVPILTVLREGDKMLTWSYALGDHLAVLEVDDNVHIDIGAWMMAVVSPSSAADSSSLGCMYTVVRHDPIVPYSQPDAIIDRGRITMILSLNRSKNGNPDAGIKLWHDYWGLPVDYDSKLTEWIRGEEKVFRAVVEVRVSAEGGQRDRRVSIKAIGPAKMPRESKSPLPAADSSTNSHMFEDLDELKSALERERIKGTLEEWKDLSESLPTDDREWTNNNNNNANNNNRNNNNNNNQDGWNTWNADQATSSSRDGGRKKGGADAETQQETKMFSTASMWSNIPRMQMRKNACSTPKKPTTDKEVKLNWRNFGTTAVDKSKDEQAVCQDSSTQGQVKTTVTTVVSRVNPSKEEIAKSIEKGFPAPLPPPVHNPAHKPHSKIGFESPNIVSTIPIREYDDTEAEKNWKAQLKKEGWEMPPEKKPLRQADDDDGWSQWYDSGPVMQPVVRPVEKPPMPGTSMPVESFLKNSTIVNVMRIKTRKCLITKVRFRHNWDDADKIQLYILDETPALVVHTMYIDEGKHSYLTGHPQFSTLGNIVDVNVVKRGEGFFVHDEMWRLVKKVDVPFREVIYEQNRVKSIELIVNAECLSPEEQNRRNDMHRYDGRRFTMLTHELLKNIVYFGNEIDAREHFDYTYEVLVEPEECLAGDAFWRVKEILWKVKKEQLGFGPAPPMPPQIEQKPWKPLRPLRPVNVELRPTADFVYTNDAIPSGKYNVTIPREERMKAVYDLYELLLGPERSNLMEAIFRQTGIDYRKKFNEALEVMRTSIPHNKSMKKELSLNADLLKTIEENYKIEEIFHDSQFREKKLWRSLQKTSQNIKAFRSTVHNLT